MEQVQDGELGLFGGGEGGVQPVGQRGGQGGGAALGFVVAEVGLAGAESVEERLDLRPAFQAGAQRLADQDG